MREAANVLNFLRRAEDAAQPGTPDSWDATLADSKHLLEARRVGNQPASMGLHPFRRSVRARRLDALNSICEEAREENWDGYGARSVTDATVSRARRLLELLPADIPDPDFAAHPDGALAFEWHASPTRSFTLSVLADRDLAYAGIFPEEKTFGTVVFGVTLHDRLIGQIRSLFSTAATARRTGG
jgi:hypothetical protein